VDHRTDIFALGITLWELLTGSRLFSADSDVGVLRAVQEREIVPAHQLNAAVDEELSAIVARALQRSREARFQTTAEFERALSRHVVSHSDSPELTDVGLWMHELFPIEAARTEPTLAQGVLAQGSLQGSTFSSKPAHSTDPAGQVQLEAGSSLGGQKYEPTVPLGPTAARPASRAASHVTPIVPAEGQTQRTPRPPWWRTSWVPWSVGAVLLLAGAGVLVPKVLRPAGSGGAQRASTGAPATESRSDDAMLDLRKGAPPPGDQERTPGAAGSSPAEPQLTKTPPAQENPATHAPPPPDRSGPTGKRNRHPGVVASTTPKKAETRQGGVPPSLGPNPASGGAPGKLVLTVSPWGDVSIDGRRLGEQVGRKEIDLPPGDHVLEVQGPSNWGPKKITIKPGEKASQAVLFN
jgi:hypothetical protein